MMSFQHLILRITLRVKRFAARHQQFTGPQPVDRLALAWWRERWALKTKQLRSERPELVFLGDSITHNWELTGPQPSLDLQESWRRFYGGRKAANLGYSGDATDNLLWRLRNGELDGLRPRLVVVMIGTNDILVHARSVDAVLAGIHAVCIELRSRVPEAAVLLLALLPSEVDAWTSRRTEQVNARLLSPGWAPPGVMTLDVGQALLRQGRADPDLFCDRLISPGLPISLHPNAEGQARYAAALEPMIASILGEQK